MLVRISISGSLATSFFGLDLAEDRRLVQLQADVKADAHQNDADQKRNAPAPRQEILIRHLRQRREYPDCGEVPDRANRSEPSTEKSAISGRRILDDHQHGSAPLAADADTLKQRRRTSSIGAAMPI